MNWKRLLPGVGVFLFLIQVLPFAGTLRAEESSSEIFKPVEEAREGELFSSGQAETGEAVFGGRKGYVHPFLSVEGYYTSNLFNEDTNEESDRVMVLSPGIWLAVPGSRQTLLRVETLNTAPGGLEVSRFREEEEKRFQGYALYRAALERHDEFSDADTETQRAEALLQYNSPGGFFLELVEIYEDDHDPYATGDSGAGQLDKFKSNLLTPSIGYRVTPKLRLEVDYRWYHLNYDAARKDYRDRDDQSFSGYVFYKATPKTSAFLEYQYVAVDFDTDQNDDNHENNVYGGLQWKVTDKSRGRVKLGYGKKTYEGSTESDRNTFLAELQADHRFTRKTSMFVLATRRVGQADIQGIRDALRYRFKVGYVQKLTAKVTARLAAHYYRDEYDGNITVGSQTDERTDDKYGGEFALGFAPTRWLNLSAGYNYTERDSNFDTYDYRTHKVFVEITAAL